MTLSWPLPLFSPSSWVVHGLRHWLLPSRCTHRFILRTQVPRVSDVHRKCQPPCCCLPSFRSLLPRLRLLPRNSSCDPSNGWDRFIEGRRGEETWGLRAGLKGNGGLKDWNLHSDLWGTWGGKLGGLLFSTSDDFRDYGEGGRISTGHLTFSTCLKQGDGLDFIFTCLSNRVINLTFFTCLSNRMIDLYSVLYRWLFY